MAVPEFFDEETPYLRPSVFAIPIFSEKFRLQTAIHMQPIQLLAEPQRIRPSVRYGAAFHIAACHETCRLQAALLSF